MEKNDTYAIAVIGDEVLDNAIRENNSYVITDVMRSIGYQNSETRIIRDDVETIAAVVKALASAYTYVFTTGGIGPTHDDKTLLAYSVAFQSPMVEHTQMNNYLNKHFSKKLRPVVIKHLSELPEGARIYENAPHWPIITVRNCFALPGIPSTVVRSMERIKEIVPFQPLYNYAEFYLRCSELILYQWLDEYQHSNPAVAFGCYPRVSRTRWQSKITIKTRDLAAFDAVFAELLEFFKKKRWLLSHNRGK